MANFPSNLIIRASGIESSDDSVLTATSMSGIFNARTRNIQKWMFDLEFAKDPKLANWQQVVGSLVNFSQGLNVITVVHPAYVNINGSASGPLTVNAAAAAGATDILAGGFASSQAGVFLAGDILRFSNSTKVYMITEDIDSGGVGEAILKLFPALRKPLLGAETLIYQNVEFTMRQLESFSINIRSPKTSTVANMELMEDLD